MQLKVAFLLETFAAWTALVRPLLFVDTCNMFFEYAFFRERSVAMITRTLVGPFILVDTRNMPLEVTFFRK